MEDPLDPNLKGEFIVEYLNSSVIHRDVCLLQPLVNRIEDALCGRISHLKVLRLSTTPPYFIPISDERLHDVYSLGLKERYKDHAGL